MYMVEREKGGGDLQCVHQCTALALVLYAYLGNG